KTKEKPEFHHPGGIVDYLQKLVALRGHPPVTPQLFALEREGDVRIEVALLWTEDTDETIRSYANGIPTSSGGTHEGGLKQAIVKAVRGFMEAKSITPKGVTLTAEEIREGIVCMLSVYLAEPQFQGKTKERLDNPVMK